MIDTTANAAPSDSSALTGPPRTAHEAASLLRAVRATPPADRGTELEWLLAALPDRPQAIRLKAETLLETDDLEDAEALLGQGLLRHPRHAGLRALRVRAHLERRELRAAEREARLLVQARREHTGALTVAGAVALAAGHPRRAISRLRRALGHRPHDARARRMLVAALLASDRPDAANVVLDGLRDPDPLLRSRVLRGQGRVREAIDVLEAHLDLGRHDACDLQIELLDLLEHSGLTPQLQALIDRLVATPGTAPGVRLRAADAALAVSGFGTAARVAAGLREDRRFKRAALSLLTVALGCLDRMDGAERAFLRLQRTPEGADPRAMARLWRRAAAARCVARQLDPRAAGDRNPSPIEPLLRGALAAFDRQDRRRPGALEPHRAACLAALGEHRAAFAAAARSMDRLAA